MANYVITQQIAVEAESAKEAVAKMDSGKVVGFTVVERPQPQAQGGTGGFGIPKTVLTGPTANP